MYMYMMYMSAVYFLRRNLQTAQVFRSLGTPLVHCTYCFLDKTARTNETK